MELGTWSLRAAAGLLLMGWLVLAVGLLAEAQRGSPEPTLRGYISDLEARRSEAALASLSPQARAQWRDFVEFQQFNRYEVLSMAVRSPSLLDALARGEPWEATEATVVADITEPSGIRWRASSVVPVRRDGGRWFLERPPFAPS